MDGLAKMPASISARSVADGEGCEVGGAGEDWRHSISTMSGNATFPESAEHGNPLGFRLPTPGRRRRLPERWHRRFTVWLLRIAIGCLRNSNPRRSVLLLRELTIIAPRVAVVRIWLARAALAACDNATAKAAIGADNLDCLPRVHLHYCRIAGFHLEMENFEEGARYLDLARGVNPFRPRVWKLLGNLNRQLDKVDQAVACFCKEAELRPLNYQKANALITAADCLADAGREEVEFLCQQILEISPTYSLAYFRLVECQQDVKALEKLIDVMRRILRSESLSEMTRKHLHFALGLAYDRGGQVDSAFAHFASGNQIHLARVPRNAFRGVHAGSFGKAVRRVFSRQMIADLSRHGCQEEFLICVIGMPRSGTSLVEQILASHSQVRGLGERTDFLKLASRLPNLMRSKKGYPQCCELLSSETIRRCTGELSMRLRSLAGQRQRVVTKRPDDYWQLGLIKILFPKVRFIHMRRDPVDTCWSCFKQDFGDLFYGSDLRELAVMYRHYEQTMQHWHEVLPPNSVLDVSYEALVAEPEEVVRSVCDSVGIPFENECLEFHRQKRSIRTASRWQVRRPVYRTSIRQSDSYREFLGPLLSLKHDRETDRSVATGWSG